MKAYLKKHICQCATGIVKRQETLRSLCKKIHGRVAYYVASVMYKERRTQRDVARVAQVTEVTVRNRFKELIANESIAKLSVVGVGMRTHSGVAATLFTALAEAGANIEIISTSEIKISVVIELDKADEAARVVHRAFKLESVG